MKNKIILLVLLLNIALNINAQFSYKSIDTKTPLAAVISMNEIDEDFDPKLMLIKAANPKPATAFNLNKQLLDQKHYDEILNYKGTSIIKLNKGNVTPPVQIRGFKANVTQSTPNDNDIAVSNNGTICSVVNTNMNILNDTGKIISARTLQSIAKGINNLNRTFDPRVMYDPEADKFILVFMQGSSSKDTRIIIGFSQTNNPALNWNFYTIPGNIFGRGRSGWTTIGKINMLKPQSR